MVSEIETALKAAYKKFFFFNDIYILVFYSTFEKVEKYIFLYFP